MSDHFSPADSVDFQTVLDGFDDLFFVCDSDGVLAYCNETVVETAGVAADELESTPVVDLFADADAQAVRAALSEAVETGRATVDADVVTAGGEDRRHAFRLSATDGGVAAVGWPVDDFTAVPASQGPLDRMTDAFFALDENWHVTYVNEQARPILSAAMGRDEDADLEGLHLWEEIPEAVDTLFYDTYHEAMATQESRTVTDYYEPLDAWLEARAYPSETGLSVYFRDVTEQYRRRQRIERREEALRKTYAVTSDAERAFEDRVGDLLELGCEMLDTKYGTLSQIRGEDYHFEVVHSPDDSVQAGDVAPLSATNCERTAATEETLVIADVAGDRPDLTDRAGYEEWGIACYLGAPVVVDDEVYGTFCFYDDEPRDERFSDWEVTLVDLMSQWVSYELTRQRARERLERQNEQLEEFASVVSHDLRNPLNVLDGSLQLAAETGEQDHFDRCTRAVDRMETLIDDLLSMARAGEDITDREQVSLATVAEEAWDVVSTPEATLSLSVDAAVSADPSRLRQLFENCFRNSVEHAGPTVVVTVGELPGGFYVADDGPGVPESDRERVFEAGYTTTADGTGFGLNIVANVAEAHGWSVSMTESEDGGARLEFTGVEKT